jgi:hypothetical protein
VTFDVDLVIQLQSDNVQRAVDGLGSLGYRAVAPVTPRDLADAAIRKSWVQEKHMVVFSMNSDQHRETSVDIFVAEPFDFDSEYNEALTGEIVTGVPVRFLRLEALIRMKEAAGRAKDLEDIRQLRLLLESPGHE